MALTAKNLLVRYGVSGRAVLDGVTTAVEPGRITIVLGPNGSGKSTLTRCLAGALPPREGEVRLDDADLYRLSARETARRIAYVGQENSMPFAFTVAELVRLGADAGNGPLSAGERTVAALRVMEVDRLQGRSVVALSGGERQRAALARALAQNADYLLLDEPTAHLDLRHQAALMRAARHAAHEQGKGVLMVLHDLTLAATHADTLLLLADGRIVAAGTPEETLTEEALQTAYRTPLLVRRAPPEASEQGVGPALWVSPRWDTESLPVIERHGE